MDDRDDLVGMKFELGGGFGTAAGIIVGRAGRDHYIVQRSGDDHLELCAITDLLAAKFYASDIPSPIAAPNRDNGKTKPRLQDRIRKN